MELKNEILVGLKKTIARLARTSACMEANSTCILLAYQPREPEKVKQLRKF